MHDPTESNNPDHVDDPGHASGRTPLAELIERRLTRRDALKGAAAALALATVDQLSGPAAADDQAVRSSLTFDEIGHGYDSKLHVAPGYDAQVLIRWGDPVLPDAPPFTPLEQTAEAQDRQFGFNNDFIAYLPLGRGDQASEHGLLCVNHEYTIARLMFPPREFGREQVEIEMAAHGHSVIEVRKSAAGWQVVPGSSYARRISVRSTPMAISGPAAGHGRLRTIGDPTGRWVLGTLNNCAGGVTPWNTVLIAEENFNIYFTGATTGPEAKNHKRYGVGPLSEHLWSRYKPRFDVSREPHEPNRFGWMVEYDPFDPQSTPTKRTALGRMKHEGAAVVLAPSGQVVVYCADDSRFEYLYKFVSADRFDPDRPQANRDLLDRGTLFVARFEEDGTLEWLPLEHGTSPLVPAKGFADQADVLIEARRAADLLGATPLDRPEDVEVDPVTGRVYAMLTNNVDRKATDVASPRVHNKHGHIVELTPPGREGERDHAATRFTWDILLLGGNPQQPADQARYNPSVSANGWLSCPDNAAFDPRGRLWIATDGMPGTEKLADGIYACDTQGDARALTRLFFNAPRGAEVTGPCFTPDGSTLFVSVQHPADEPESTFAEPSTRWPDFSADMPPRPAVVAITRRGGGPIGG